MGVRLVRSFPAVIPPGRAYVADEAERFLMRDYDYRGLPQFAGGDHLILLEWDIAVSRYDLSMFTARAHLTPNWPLVAPYLIGDPGECVHAREEADGSGYRHLRDGEPDCDVFGLGLIYLPNWVLRDYPKGTAMSDGTLSRWLRTQPGWRPVGVDWGTRVVHLH